MDYNDMTLQQKMAHIQGLVAEANSIKKSIDEALARLKDIKKEMDGLEKNRG